MFFGGLLFFTSTSFSEEVVGYENQAKLARIILDDTKQQETGVKTWSGKVQVLRNQFKDKTQQVLLEESTHEIVFFFDYLHAQNKTIVKTISSIGYENGRRIPYLLSKDTLLAKDGVYYRYQTFDVMPEVRKTEEVLKISNNFHISDKSFETFMNFDPLQSSWPSSVADIYAIFESYDLSDKLRKRMTEKDRMTEKQIDDFFAQMRANGFPGMKVRKSGDLFSIERVHSGRKYLLDLTKKSKPISFYIHGVNPDYFEDWKFELQNIQGFWIPKTIQSITSLNIGYTVKTLSWKDQKINESIHENEFTLPSLGIRQGDECYDLSFCKMR